MGAHRPTTQAERIENLDALPADEFPANPVSGIMRGFVQRYRDALPTQQDPQGQPRQSSPHNDDRSHDSPFPRLSIQPGRMEPMGKQSLSTLLHCPIRMPRPTLS